MTHKMTSIIMPYSENGIDYIDYSFINGEFLTVITRIDESLENEVEYVVRVKYIATNTIKHTNGTTLLGAIHAAQLAINELKDAVLC